MSRWCCFSSSTTAFSKCSEKMSRTTRTERSASWNTSDGAGEVSTRCSRTSWSLKRYCSSRSKSSRLAPDAGVRMIAAPSSRSRPLGAGRRRGGRPYARPAAVEVQALAGPPEALALLVVEALRHADALAGRRVDHVAPGDGQLHREARALGLERVLDDLDDDLLAGLEQVGDLRPAAAAV